MSQQGAAPGPAVAATASSAACLAYLAELRWAAGFRCPGAACGGRERVVLSTRGLSMCRKCRRQFSATSGTALHRLRVPLPLVFEIARAMLEEGEDLSGRALQNRLGLTSYKTVAGVLQRLRVGMEQYQEPLLGAGGDDADTWCRSLVRGKPLHGYHKSVVIVLAQVNRPAVRAWIAPRPNDPLADTMRWYGTNEDPPDEIPYEPHRAQRLMGELHQWLHVKLRGVSHELLQSYLDEFAFRHSNRHLPDRGFEKLMRHLLTTRSTRVRRAPFRFGEVTRDEPDEGVDEQEDELD